MRLIAIAALVGASSILLLPTLPAWWLLLALSLLALSGFLLIHVFDTQVAAFILWISVAILFFCYAILIAQHRLDWQVPKDIENKPILIQGTMASVPDQEGLDMAFEFA